MIIENDIATSASADHELNISCDLAQWPYQIIAPQGSGVLGADQRCETGQQHQKTTRKSVATSVGRSNSPTANSELTEFVSLLPDKPYCADDPQQGLVIRSRATAIKHRHIQLNSPQAFCFLSFDVDVPGAYFAHDDGNLPSPNFIAENPGNGHAHIVYRLRTPVQNFAGSRSSPLHYLAAVQRGLRRRLSADPHYTGLLVKNPLHPNWRTEWLAREPYDLSELADWLFPHNLAPELKRERSGLGRNCDVFDDTRCWAYRNVLKFKRDGGSLGVWIERCRKIAHARNQCFVNKLPVSEIRAIGKSIANWTWRKFSEVQFSIIQSYRGKRGAARRWAGHISAEVTKPWMAQGISRRTWYRLRAKAKRGRSA